MFFTSTFLRKREGDHIIESIRKAESNTSGEIRVHFQKRFKGDLWGEAASTFRYLKMDQTAQRNGVLIYIVPKKKIFCIMGDTGINAVVPENFWEEIKDDLSLHFKNDNMAEGLCANIERIGVKLKEHFPIQSDDKNELPDTISYG